MAEKRIEKNDVFEPGLLVDIINQTKELEKAVRGNIAAFSDLLKTNPFETVKDVKEYQAAVSGVVAGTQTLKTAQEENKKATDELNASLAREVAISEKVKEELNDINGTLEQNIKLQTQRKTQISLLAAEQKALTNEFNRGRVSAANYNSATAKLSKQTQELKVANSQLGFTIKAQIKEGQAASTSFEQQAQRLGQLRTAYRKLNEEQRNNEEVGGSLLKSIKVLDKQVKENDASIGNFQRNVGNYTGGIKKAAEQTGLFDGILRKVAQAQGIFAASQTAISVATGKTTGALKIFRLALISTGIGAIVVAVGSLIAALLSSEEGFNKINKGLKAVGIVVGNVSDVFAALGDQIISFFSGDGFDTTKITAALDDLINKTGEEIEQQNKLSDKTAENLKLQRELTVEVAKGEKEIAELRAKAKDEEQFGIEERLKFVEQAKNIELKLIEKELFLAERKNEIAQKELSFNRSGTEELNAAAEAEAELFRIQTKRFNRTRELQSELNRLKKQGELNISEVEEDDVVFDSDLEAQLKRDRDAFNEREKLRAKEEKEVEDSLAKQVKLQEKALDEQLNNERKADDEAAALRKKQLEDNIQTANQLAQGLANSLDQRSQNRIEKIQAEETENEKALERQERRAEQGLSNEVAFNQKKAAELEQQREEEQRKAERNAKILSYFNLLSEYAKENPNTAAGKALAQVAIAETVSGLFYEGTDRVGDDTSPNPFMKGKDNTIIGVTPEERIFGHKQSLGIRAMFGSITNDQLIEYAKMGYNNSTTTTATLNDVRIVQAVKGVEQAVKSNQQVIEIDTLNQIVDSRINQHGMKTKRVHKRTRL